MSKALINWDEALPHLNHMSLMKVYISIVAGIIDDYTWYSNKETISKIAWRWQMGESTVKLAVKNLTTKGLLERTSRGIFTVNKDYIV